MQTKEISTVEPKVSSRTRRIGKRLRSALVLGLPVIATAGTALWLSQSSAEATSGGEGAPPPAPTVTVASAERRLVVDQDERIGRVAATERVELRPEVSGRIEAVRFESGQRVTEGQILFNIDARPYSARVNAAQAAVARSEARAQTARREADRAEALRLQEAISREEADLRISRAAEAKAELLAAQAALDSAQIDLERTQVRAPISGRVSRAYVTAGNLVSGNPGAATLLTTIVSTGEVHVYLDVDEATIQRFRSAQADNEILTDEQGRVPVQLRMNQETHYNHEGYVESLDNRIDPATGSLTVRLLFSDPEERLLPGSFVRVQLPLSKAKPQLVVSERAIGTDQSQKFVLTVQPDETVAYRPVILGPSLGNMRVIQSGLEPEDRVIVNGLQRVRPGMTVQAEAASAGPDNQVALR